MFLLNYINNILNCEKLDKENMWRYKKYPHHFVKVNFPLYLKSYHKRRHDIPKD